jgi:hypothetical protein
VVLSGVWNPNSHFDIRFEGRGTVALWVQSGGALDPSVSPGALFPFASKEGTINIPASSPALIAVGATLNRVEWEDSEGTLVRQPQHGSLEVAPLDTTAYFSSAGPNALGAMKPDIVAPGANVVGAMSALADPRRSSTSSGIFEAGGRCEAALQCYVVDDFHAVSSGTSMAAPLVAGAAALLFEGDPSLTQEGIRALLQAGARPLEGAVFDQTQTGVGALDLAGSLEAQLAPISPIARLPSRRSWLKLSASYAHPEPEWRLQGVLELRDEAGRIADGFDSRRLALAVMGGNLVQPLTRVAPGLHRFAVSAPRGSGGRELTVQARFDDLLLVSQSLPIAVDPGAKTGVVSPRGGCAVNPAPLAPLSSGSPGALLMAAAGLWLFRGARSRRHSRAK